jgi:hypothetical protein
MYDNAGALLDHRRQERAIEAHGAEEVLVERLVPFRVVEYGEAARRRGGAAHDMNDDVDTTETAEDRVRDGCASFDRRYIGDDEVLGVGKTLRPRTSRGQSPGAGLAQRRNNGLTDALGAARHERALALKSEIAAHDLISRAAILPPSSVNTKSSVTGLPGKFPASFVLTTVLPSRADAATGSSVCWYFFAVSNRHALMALRPFNVWPSSCTVASDAKHSASASVSCVFSDDMKTSIGLGSGNGMAIFLSLSAPFSVVGVACN